MNDLQSLSNPDTTERETVPLWSAPIALGDAILVRSGGARGQFWQRLHVFARMGKNEPYALVKTITLRPACLHFTADQRPRRNRLWRNSDPTNCLRVSQGAHCRALVLTPTGEPFEWSQETIQYPP
ncbi:MAG: hypothetical protein U0636_10555 [Phycisphaerales bacterium]